MFDQAQLMLTGQLNDRRKWGLVLLLLSSLTAVPVGYALYTRWVGWMQYPVAAGGFVVALIIAAQVWGTVLTKVRERWSA